MLDLRIRLRAWLRPAGADEEVLDCQVPAYQRETSRDLQGLDERPARLGVTPVMRCREVLLDGQLAGQAGPEGTGRLDVGVGPVDRRRSVIEVHVRRDEPTVLFEQVIDLGELLLLEFARVFEDSLRDDDVELLAVETDRRFQEVRLSQVRRGLVYRDVDPEVADVLLEQVLQRPGSAANVEQVTLPVTSDLVNDASALLQLIVRRGEFQVLFNPELRLLIHNVPVGVSRAQRVGLEAGRTWSVCMPRCGSWDTQPQ
jgi:hypothetical protein